MRGGPEARRSNLNVRKRCIMKPIKIDNVLNKVVKKLKIQDRVDEETIKSNWSQLVGDQLSRHTKPSHIRKKCLYVSVDSSVWLHQLSFIDKGAILQKLTLTVGPDKIKDISFRIDKA